MRASRSMPFISKTYNVNFIELATRSFAGELGFALSITYIPLGNCFFFIFVYINPPEEIKHVIFLRF